MRSENSGVSDATNRSWFPCQENMAGFDRHFRFTGQKHICAAAKKEGAAQM